MKKILLVVILLITTLTLSGCYDGLVSDEEYSNLIAGVTATKQNGQTVDYNLDILKDETHFNNEIESAVYCKLDIRQVKECKIKGLCFFVRSSQDCTLEFSMFTNNKMLVSMVYDLKSFESQEVGLFPQEGFILNDSNSLHIEINEQNNYEEKTKFVFDTFVIFFEES